MAWLDPRGTTASRRDAQMREALRHLRRSDAVVAALIRRFGDYQLSATRSPFQVMLETVVSQQLSTSAAGAIYGRLSRAIGPGAPRPAAVLQLSRDDLLSCGLSRSKVEYVRNVALAFEKRGLDRRSLARMDDAAVAELLTSIKGIGEWSAHMFLIFALRRLDVFPIGDLGLRNAMASQYGLRRNTAPSRYHRIADAWRPYRTVGSLYLWKSYDGA
jgi:DNA-3-methyladenine glycosylase II